MSENPQKNSAGVNPRDARLTGLLLLAQSGDSRSLEALVSEYRPLLDASVTKYSGNLSESELDELRQEALLAFCRAVGKYDPLYGDVSFGLFAKVCVRNALASALRTILADNGRNNLPLDVLEEVGAGCPEDEVIESEKADELRRMIRAMLSPYENMVWWSYYAGVPVKTIAAQLGKPAASVENALRRTRRKLKAALK